jgi:hypothetical protein
MGRAPAGHPRRTVAAPVVHETLQMCVRVQRGGLSWPRDFDCQSIYGSAESASHPRLVDIELCARSVLILGPCRLLPSVHPRLRRHHDP